MASWVLIMRLLNHIYEEDREKKVLIIFSISPIGSKTIKSKFYKKVSIIQF